MFPVLAVLTLAVNIKTQKMKKTTGRKSKQFTKFDQPFGFTMISDAILKSSRSIIAKD